MEPKIIVDVKDVSNKWLDDTKTTTTLVLVDHLGLSTPIAYVHSSDTVEQVLNKKDEYKKKLLKAIEENIEW